MTDDADDDKPSDAKPRAATDPPQTRKQEALPPPVVTTAKPFETAAEYIKGYEKQPGRLEIKDGELVFSTPKKDLAGKIALAGILALALDQLDRLVTIPLADIVDLGTPSDKRKLEIKTKTETLTFGVDDREAWLRAFAGKEAALDLNAPLTYPDDAGLAIGIRKIDHYIGVCEQVVLVAMLATVVLTAATHAILDRLFHIQLDFKEEVVRAGTFAIAIIGTVFATQQARHLAMDLISRRLSPRNRLVLKIMLALFTAFIVVLLTHAGFHTIEIEKTMQQHSKMFSSVMIAWIIPIGGFLMLAHLFLHTVIDIDYLVRGKTPPERVRSGH